MAHFEMPAIGETFKRYRVGAVLFNTREQAEELEQKAQLAEANRHGWKSVTTHIVEETWVRTGLNTASPQS